MVPYNLVMAGSAKFSFADEEEEIACSAPPKQRQGDSHLVPEPP